MANSIPEKIVASVSIDLAGKEAKIEKLLADETGKATLRISGGQIGESVAGPLTLSEKQLIELLYKASLSGVLSNDFIGQLREKIEI
ncbi:MAG: hypothetical protein WCE68_03020 [Anaerolineales bacterium]